MATEELRELLYRYRTAYTSYMHCVQTVSDAAQKGEWLSAEAEKLEEQALGDLTAARQAVLDALHAHAKKPPSRKK
jgi:hypothetical protein